MVEKVKGMAFKTTVAMPCERCGGILDHTKDKGATEEGQFTEKYECVECGAIGWISGDASDPPQHWNRTGSAFREAV